MIGLIVALVVLYFFGAVFFGLLDFIFHILGAIISPKKDEY